MIERDNLIGAAARVKTLFRIPLSDLQPVALGEAVPVVAKEQVRDLIPDLQATGGYIVDKVEGFAIDAAGQGWWSRTMTASMTVPPRRCSGQLARRTSLNDETGR